MRVHFAAKCTFLALLYSSCLLFEWPFAQVLKDLADNMNSVLILGKTLVSVVLPDLRLIFITHSPFTDQVRLLVILRPLLVRKKHGNQLSDRRQTPRVSRAEKGF